MAEIVIRGERFDSPLEAAKHYGVEVRTIYSAKHGGRLDYVGLGKGQKSKKITVKGKEYRSHVELAHSIGVTNTEISMFVKVSRLLGIDYS